jgi:arylsulfatase A-like enzyme
MMGAVLDALARSPAANNTFILFTSDHGEMHLEHRHVVLPGPSATCLLIWNVVRNAVNLTKLCAGENDAL